MMGTILKDTAKPLESSSAVRIYSDGGSRGNPGPSASGFVIQTKEEKLLYEGGEYLGVTTNNQAEYQAARLGLEKALDMGAKHVDFKMDSLLVVNQLNGDWKIKHRELLPIYEAIKTLVGEFESVTFSHVRREYNKLADEMVNKILDAHEAREETAGWVVTDKGLYNKFEFKDFTSAFAFMTRVAALAEAARHHPTWTNSWNIVEIWLITHDKGDVISEKDYKLAAQVHDVV